MHITIILFLLALATHAIDLNKAMPQINFGNTTILSGVSDSKPVIDGIMSAYEWVSATVLNGFHRKETDSLIHGKTGQVYLQHDNHFLYLAIKTITPNDSPGGGLICRIDQRDGEVHKDDCIELTFNSENTPDIIQQMVFNSNAICFDCQYHPMTHFTDISWNITGIEAKSKVESEWWVLELKIPLSELKPKNNKLLFNVARNWLDIGAFSTLNSVEKYRRQSGMIELQLLPATVTVRQTELGSPWEGHWKLQFSATNHLSDDILFAIFLHDYAWPKINGEVKTIHSVNLLKSQIVKPGETQQLDASYEAKDNRKHRLATAVFDLKTGNKLFARQIIAEKSRALGRRPVYASGDLKDKGSFIAYDYPGFNRATIDFKFNSDIPESMTLTSPDGKASSFLLTGKNNQRNAKLDIPSAEGKYTASLPDGTYVCDFVRKRFPWQDNNIGQEKIVLPPFQPITLEKNQVAVLFRKQKINGFGLWDSIISKNEELLCAPMFFEMLIEGRKAEWDFSPVEIQVNNSGHDLSFASKASSPSGIEITVQGYAEYDGFFWNRFKISNSGRKLIEKLTLVIPLKNEMIPLYHIISNTIRSNPAGVLPEEQGKLWDGTMLRRQLHYGQEVMHQQLVPYVWLGGIERGLCWFLDSSFGYSLAPDLPMVRISRNENEVKLEVDIVNLPVNVKEFDFEFGLQATPIKPINPELFKMTRDQRTWSADKLPNLAAFNQIRGGFPSQWAAMPFNGDYTLYSKVIEIIQKGTTVPYDIVDEIKQFFDKYGYQMENEMRNEYPKQAAAVIKSALSAGSLTDPRKRASRSMMYTDPHLAYRYEEAVKYYKSEWWNTAAINYTAVWRVTLTPTLQDYLLYSMRELLRCGLRGINLDDAYLMPDNNPDTVARIDIHGIVHPEIGILRIRNYIKRMATMMHSEFSMSPRYIEVHMTNGLIVPSFAFADGQLGFEQHYGENPMTERFDIGEILATYTGRQIGAKPLGLCGMKRLQTPVPEWSKLLPALTRSSLALMLPFGITPSTPLRPKYDAYDPGVIYPLYDCLADFGVAENDCRFVPCFENDGAVTSDQKDLLIASYRRRKQVLTIVSNVSKKKLQTVLRIDADKLGIPANYYFSDWETREAVGRSITLTPGNFALFYIGSDPVKKK